MESMTPLFEQVARLKDKGIPAVEIVATLHREGRTVGEAIISIERVFNMERRSAERLVVDTEQYRQFSYFFDEEEPEIDFAIDL